MTELLERIVANLAPTARALFEVAYREMANPEEVTERKILAKKKLSIMRAMENRVYHNLAHAAFRSITGKLQFVAPTIFPIPSRSGTSFGDWKPVFIDGGQQVGLAMTFGTSENEVKVKVDISYEPTFSPDRLSRRLFDEEVVVNDYDSFVAYFKAATTRFREANPFQPFPGEPEPGDLVYMVQYARSEWKSFGVATQAGTIIPPEHRIGVINMTDDGLVAQSLASDGPTYRLPNVEAQPTDRTWSDETEDDGEYEQDEITGRGHQRDTDQLDEVHIIRKAPWDPSVLDEPFMGDEEVEEIVIPALLHYGEDPRVIASHVHRQTLISQYFGQRIAMGESVTEVVSEFVDDFQFTPMEVLQLAGGDPKHLVVSYHGQIDLVLEALERFPGYIATLVDETCQFIGIDRDELIREEPYSVDDPVDLSLNVVGRRVTYTVDDEHKSGYVGDIFVPPDGSEGIYLHVHTDPENNLVVESVAAADVQVASVDELLDPRSLAEVEHLKSFISTAIYRYEERARRAGTHDADLAARCGEARELLDDKMDDIRKSHTAYRKNITIFSNDEDSDRQYFTEIKWWMDENIIGPMLSIGYDDTAVAAYFEGYTENKMIHMLVQSALQYRGLKKNNPFTKSETTKEILQAYVEMREHLSGMNLLMAFMQLCQPSRELGHQRGDDIMHIQDALNAVQVDIITTNEGCPVSPIRELIEETSTGRSREYFHRGDVARVIGGMVATGRNDQAAVEQALKGDVTMPGIVRVEESESSPGYWSLLITDTVTDVFHLGYVLIDELAKFNSDDPRNAPFNTYFANLDERTLFENLHHVPQLYLRKDSLYAVAFDSNWQEVQSHHRHDRSHPHVYVSFANSQPERISVADPDNLPELIATLRAQGMPIREDVEHEVKEDDSGTYFNPVYEIPMGDESIVFVVGREEKHRHHDEYRSRRHRRFTMEWLEDAYMGVNYDHIYVSSNWHEFFSPGQARQILVDIGDRICDEFGLDQSRIQAYTNYLIHGTHRHGIEIPQLTEGDDDDYF